MQSQTNSPVPTWTILNLLKWTTDYFNSHDIESPRADAEVLLAHALKVQRIDLYVRYDQPLTAEELSLFKTMIKRRVRREPVAYIIGVKEFWSMELRVSADVLIPRPETECLVETALPKLPEDRETTVFEIGTGSGAISLALASERPRCRVFASDLSIQAIRMARYNAGQQGVADQIRFLCGEDLQPISDRGDRFDLIVSNPPYIRADIIDGLQPEITCYEPRLALDGGPDGLDCIRAIIQGAHTLLKPEGYLMLEIGYDQRADLTHLVEEMNAYESVAFTQDYAGYDRVATLYKSG